MIQNRYLIVQPIGKGGMGEVYLAIDQRLGSAVALKRTFFNEDEALGNAFEREARILARLRHPVLPKVIDHFIENNDQFLVMEHISGDDLAKRLESAGKPFPLSWVMFWADQMLDALNYLHSHEPPIVHRDIKPQNLKLTDDNHIVLLDFGLSKDFETGKSNSLNSASVAGYSPHFASMEQIRGTGTDARSDLYSLSATLYQLLTNQAPSDALTRADALLGNGVDPIIPLNQLNPEVTPVISDVILKGVAIRQNDRFETAAEMQKALRRAFGQGKGQATEKTTAAVNDAITAGQSARALQPTEPVHATARSEPFAVASDTRETPAGDTAAVQTSEQKTAIFTMPGSESAPPEVYQPAPPPGPEHYEAPATRTAVAEARPAAAPPATRVSEIPPPPPAMPPAQSAQKKSKAGLVVGGLFGLLLLFAAAAAGGWFAYNNYYKAAAVPPAPSPLPTVAAPTPEKPLVAESSPEAINSATEQSEITPLEANANTTPAPSGAPRPTPLVTTKAGQPKAGQPTAKAPSKPTKPADRTVIEQ